MDKRTNNFDLLRAFAALQVAIVHAASHLGIDDGLFLHVLKVIPGVPIFFVISGYLVSRSFEQSESVHAYAWKRALRIFPGLWACLAVSMLLATSIGGVHFTSEALPWLAAQMTFVQFYNPDFLRDFGVGVLNGSLWTIPVELQFYMSIPLLYACAPHLRRPITALMTMLTLIAINRLYSVHAWEESIVWKLLGVTVFPYLYMFMLGVLLQLAKSFTERYVVGHAEKWLAAFVATSLVMWFIGLEIESAYLNPISAIMLGMTVISLAHAKPAITLGADISYGLYIYHMPIINAAVHLGFSGAPAALMSLGLTAVLAAMSWFVVEQPALRMKRLIVRRSYSQ